MLPVGITDATGTGASAKVTPIGQLVVAPLAYDETEFKVLDLVNVAYSFYPPRQERQFVLTGIYFRADKDVSNTVDATVVVYEADAVDTTGVNKVLMQFATIRDTNVLVSPLNILVSTGMWVNAKTDDDDIHMTITGYYIPKLG